MTSLVSITTIMSAQLSNDECPTTATGFADLLQRITPLAKQYEENRKEQDVDTGFNLFELISDHYYRETFHSDILKALLDPEEKHNSGNKYLNLFLQFLCDKHLPDNLKIKIDLKDYSNAQVLKEKGRIDILIKGCGHAIIIENKILGAADQEKQLFRYLETAEKEYKYNVDAIVYLRLNKESSPDMSSWTDEQKRAVKDKLIIICAFNGNDDRTEKDLLNGWILKCEKASSGLRPAEPRPGDSPVPTGEGQGPLLQEREKRFPRLWKNSRLDSPDSHLQNRKRENAVLSWGRVALLGIAQRHVQVSRAHIPTDRYPPKPLPTSIQTIGDAIHVKRREKGLNRWRLAYKMGIATLTVRDWEYNTSQPDQEQLTRLEKILGFKSDAILPKPPH